MTHLPSRGSPPLRAGPLLALLLAGCSTAGPPPTMPVASPAAGAPESAGDAATSCSGRGAGAGPTSYPGWPPNATSELVPVPVSSELAIGPNRFLLNLLDESNEPLASADRPVELRFFDLAAEPATPATTVEASYLATTDELPGLYRADVDFPCWGEWGVEVATDEADGSQRTGRMVFPVRPRSTTPAIGAPAPASETPTAATPEEIRAISTDTQPEPHFYDSSVSQALAENRPFLVIFATPAFCRTRTCGPALDIIKSVAPEYRDEVDFIHVEPYELAMVDGQVQPVLSDQNLPLPVEAVSQWGLPTEPYIFVVDAAGAVRAKLEGVASVDEIRAALDELARGG